MSGQNIGDGRGQRCAEQGDQKLPGTADPRGFTRFEIMALDADRDLIRNLARRLAEEGPEAEEVRALVATAVTGEPPRPGGILSALRRSPLVGAGLDLSRPHEDGRTVEL